jgi:hypothetical protein
MNASHKAVHMVGETLGTTGVRSNANKTSYDCLGLNCTKLLLDAKRVALASKQM